METRDDLVAERKNGSAQQPRTYRRPISHSSPRHRLIRLRENNNRPYFLKQTRPEARLPTPDPPTKAGWAFVY